MNGWLDEAVRWTLYTIDLIKSLSAILNNVALVAMMHVSNRQLMMANPNPVIRYPVIIN